MAFHPCLSHRHIDSIVIIYSEFLSAFVHNLMCVFLWCFFSSLRAWLIRLTTILTNYVTPALSVREFGSSLKTCELINNNPCVNNTLTVRSTELWQKYTNFDSTLTKPWRKISFNSNFDQKLIRIFLEELWPAFF